MCHVARGESFGEKQNEAYAGLAGRRSQRGRSRCVRPKDSPPRWPPPPKRPGACALGIMTCFSHQKLSLSLSLSLSRACFEGSLDVAWAVCVGKRELGSISSKRLYEKLLRIHTRVSFKKRGTPRRRLGGAAKACFRQRCAIYGSYLSDSYLFAFFQFDLDVLDRSKDSHVSCGSSEHSKVSSEARHCLTHAQNPCGILTLDSKGARALLDAFPSLRHGTKKVSLIFLKTLLILRGFRSRAFQTHSRDALSPFSVSFPKRQLSRDIHPNVQFPPSPFEIRIGRCQNAHCETSKRGGPLSAATNVLSAPSHDAIGFSQTASASTYTPPSLAMA